MSDDLREALESAEGWGEDSEGETYSAGEEGAEALEEETQAQTKSEVDDDPHTETQPYSSGQQENHEVQAQENTDKTSSEGDTSKESVQAKAPASWTPAARESWGKIPASAQAQIAKREKEMEAFMRDTATARKTIGKLKETLEPYHNSMMAAGVQDPFKVIGSLMNNDHILRHGTAQNKAELVASMINKFNVDIGALDSMLAGQPNQTQTPGALPAHIEDAINQRMAPINQMMQNQQIAEQQQKYQIQQDAANQVEQFGRDKEFLQDVRHDMADLMDMAANQGREMSMDEAYNKACLLRPDIQKIIQDRQTIVNSQNIQQKQNAASSVVGTPAGMGNGSMINTGNEMRDAISNAWADAMDG